MPERADHHSSGHLVAGADAGDGLDLTAFVEDSNRLAFLDLASVWREQTAYLPFRSR